MNRWRLAAAAALVLAAAPVARAQGTPPANDSGPSGRLIGRVLYREGDNGVPFATVTLTPPGTTRFADSLGAFVFARVTPGLYHLRARQIGYSPFDTSVQVLPAPAITNVTLRLRHVVRLAQITVRAKAPKGCAAPGLPDSLVDPALALVFSQMRENVFRMRVLMTEYPFRERRIDDFINREYGSTDRRVETDTVETESWDIPDYRPGEVLENGFDSRGRPGQYLRLVQFQDLTERQFVENHCFHMTDDASGLARIDFVPADRLMFADIEGSVYLDPEKMIVRHATFELTRPHSARPPIRDWTYSSTFSEIVPMVPMVERFHSIFQGGYRAFSQIEDGQVVDHSFIREAPVNPDVRDTLAGPAGVKTIVAQATFGSPESGQPHCAPPAPQPFTEALTGTILAYADSAASPSWRAGAKSLLGKILAKLNMPTTVELTTVGYPVPASAQDAAGRGALRVAPGIFGRYAFDLDAQGMAYEVRVASTSMSSDVDSALVQAIRGAKSDRLHGQTIVLAVSTAAVDTSLSMQLAHIQVPSWLLARSASYTPPATATPTASTPSPVDTASFEFIVDDQGHPVLGTVHRIGWPTEMDQLTEGAADSLSNRIYRPALVGRCPVSQVSTQRFDFVHQ